MKQYLKNDFDFSKLIDVFDELPIWSAPFGLKLLDYINYKTNISAVDLGFGTGFPLTEIALRLGDSSVVYGIDPWKDAIERVNKKVNYYGLTNVRIIEGVAEFIPLDNDSIDLITSNNGINNVNDIDKVLSECSRIIKQGGQFVQTMNTDKTMFEFYGQLEQVLSDLHMDKEIDLMRQHILYKRPPIDKMISMIQKHGFGIKDLEHDQFNYRFANGTALLNHYFIRLAFMDSWIKLLPSDKVEQIFDTIELRLNEQSKILDGIKLSIPYVLINAIKE
ncbi:MAG: class I SAM-dependent methyltransferase [Lentimicrobiaceae bacterium]|nr:class I SAM-dependent methyltransferase [Lentimicrobiaceae bacterium]